MKLDIESQRVRYAKGLYALAVIYDLLYILHYNFNLEIKEFNFLLWPIWLFLTIGPIIVHFVFKNFTATVWTITTGAFGILVGFMWTAGGLMAPSTIWLTALPLALGLLLGTSGVIGGIVFTCVIFTGYAVYGDRVPNIVKNLDEYLIYKNVNLAVYFVFLMSSLFIYRRQETREKQIIIDESEKTSSLFKVLLHDVGNDINSIFANVERLKDNSQIPLNIESLEKRLHNLVNLISQLRQLKEFNDCKELVNTTALAINELLLEAHCHCQDAAQAKFIDIKYELSQEPLYIKGEESLFLHTILLNFLSNAIKFSHSKGEIILRSYLKDDLVRIEIEDYGIGIPLDMQKQLFKGKKSISRTGTSGEKGSGYGLELARRYVELHKGTLDIISLPSKQGTLIVLTFPQFALDDKKPQPI